MIDDVLKEYLTQRVGMNIHMILPFEGSALDQITVNQGHLNGELKEVIGNSGWIVYSKMLRVNIEQILMFWFSDK